MKQTPVQATGMVWYLPEDFAEIKAMMVDAGFVKGGASIHHLEHRMPDIRALLEKQS